MALPACALLLCAGLLHWLLVPAGELAALNPGGGAEAYLWRSMSGRNVLLLRQAGLERAHAAETVTSALRCRGINRLHAIVWLDEVPEKTPLEGYSAPPIEPGAALAAEFDMRWLAHSGRVYGACFGMGRSSAQVIWDTPRSQGSVEATASRASSTTFLHASTWERLSADFRRGLGRVVLLVDRSYEAGENAWAGECCFRSAPGGSVRAENFRPSYRR